MVCLWIIFRYVIAELIVGSVMTSEYQVLHVLIFLPFSPI